MNFKIVASKLKITTGISFRALLKKHLQSRVVSFIDLDTGKGSFIAAFREYLDGEGYIVQRSKGTEPFDFVMKDAALDARENIVKANAQFPEEFKSLGFHSFDVVTVNSIESAPAALIACAKERLRKEGVLFITVEEGDVMNGVDATLSEEMQKQGFEVTRYDKPEDYPEFDSFCKATVLLVGTVKLSTEERIEKFHYRRMGITADERTVEQFFSLKLFEDGKSLYLPRLVKPAVEFLQTKEEELNALFCEKLGLPAGSKLLVNGITKQSQGTMKIVYMFKLQDATGKELHVGVRFFPKGLANVPERIARADDLAKLSPEIIKSWKHYEMSEMQGKVNIGFFNDSFTHISVGEFRKGQQASSYFGGLRVDKREPAQIEFGKMVARLWLADLKNSGSSLSGYFDTDQTRWASNHGYNEATNEFFLFDVDMLGRVPINFIMEASKCLDHPRNFRKGLMEQLQRIVEGENLSDYEQEIRTRIQDKGILSNLESLIKDLEIRKLT